MAWCGGGGDGPDRWEQRGSRGCRHGLWGSSGGGTRRDGEPGIDFLRRGSLGSTGCDGESNGRGEGQVGVDMAGCLIRDSPSSDHARGDDPAPPMVVSTPTESPYQVHFMVTRRMPETPIPVRPTLESSTCCGQARTALGFCPCLQEKMCIAVLLGKHVPSRQL